jgi:hypothetical protein
MTGLVGRLIGVACAALGVFLLWASPISTDAFPNVAGAIFLGVGLLFVLFAA